MNIETMTEEQAYDLFCKMKAQFNWRGMLFTKNDVEESLVNWNEDEDNDIKLTAEEVMDTRYWYKEIENSLDEEWFTFLQEAMWEAAQTKKKGK